MSFKATYDKGILIMRTNTDEHMEWISRTLAANKVINPSSQR